MNRLLNKCFLCPFLWFVLSVLHASFDIICSRNLVLRSKQVLLKFKYFFILNHLYYIQALNVN
jgi:hypothetical protein